MTTRDCFVSVIAPLQNDAPILLSFVKDVTGVLERDFSSYELLLVDDGSTDDTQERVHDLLMQFKCVRYIRLSRSYGIEIALESGLESVIGDFVVVMMPDMDPPEMIPELVNQCRSGKNILFGLAKDHPRGPLLFRSVRSLFYLCTKWLFRVSLPKNTTRFQVFTRQAVNAITQIKDKHRYLHLLSSHVGFGIHTFDYKPTYRYGKPKPIHIWDKLRFGIAIIVTNSRHPLRVVTWMGLFAGGINALYVCYVLLIFLFKRHVAEGWTTLSLQSAGMFFFVFLILTVLAEYIGYILEESKTRPLYFIVEEKNSSINIAHEDRANVVYVSSAQEK